MVPVMPSVSCALLCMAPTWCGHFSMAGHRQAELWRLVSVHWRCACSGFGSGGLNAGVLRMGYKALRRGGGLHGSCSRPGLQRGAVGVCWPVVVGMCSVIVVLCA